MPRKAFACAMIFGYSTGDVIHELVNQYTFNGILSLVFKRHRLSGPLVQKDMINADLDDSSKYLFQSSMWSAWPILGFSFIGCLFMIVIWIFRRYVVFAQRLILYLSIAALLDSIAYLMSSDIADGPVCNFQGWWLTYFDWQVLLSVGCITFNLFMNAVKQISTEKLYVTVCFAVPLIISCIPLIGDHYGPAGAWCWIVEDFSWKVGIWYGPLFIIIILLLVAYGSVVISLRRKASNWEGTNDPDTERQHHLLKEDIKPLRIYPFIYLAVSIFPLINRLERFQATNRVQEQIKFITQGALNAIAFGVDKDTLSKLRPSETKLAMRAKLAPKSTVQEYTQSFQDTDELKEVEQD